MRHVMTTLVWAAGFAAAGFLGRLTIVDERSLSLVWPAAGVAVVWMLAQRARFVGIDTAALVLTTYLVNTLTGASPQLGLVFILANVVQAWTVVLLLRRWCPHLWGAGGTEPLSRVRDVFVLLGAAAVGTTLATTVGMTGLAVTGVPVDWVSASVWWGRNVCGVLAVGSLGLLLGERLALRRRWDDLRRSAGETFALFVVSGILFQVAFAVTDLPLAFPLLVTTVWAGLRLPSLFVVAHSLLVGATAVVFTLRGQGPFTGIEPIELGALLAQLFVGMSVVTGLVLAIGKDERERLARDLSESTAHSQQQAALMQTVFSQISEGIALVGDDGRLLMVNPAAQHNLGLREGDSLREQRVTRPDGTPIEADDRPAMRALEGETVVGEDIVVQDADTQRILATAGNPLPPERAGDRRAVMVYRDVTQQRLKERELLSFAGVVAHDLKNPLSMAEGWTEALDDLLALSQATGRDLDVARAREMAGKVGVATTRMRGLISDLLNHAMAADRQLELRPIDLAHLVHDVASARASLDHVTLGQLPTVTADEVLLRQLLDNLIGNAVKYVALGVTPHVRLHCDPPVVDGMATICVDDDGIGVPEGQHERIFEQFHRAHAADYKGTGLGLAICQRIVARHGGRIWAQPGTAGVGTRFCFTLPVA